MAKIDKIKLPNTKIKFLQKLLTEAYQNSKKLTESKALIFQKNKKTC